MKKFLFLSLLIIALSYPAITLLAQEAAKDLIEDMLIVEVEQTETDLEINNAVEDVTDKTKSISTKSTEMTKTEVTPAVDKKVISEVKTPDVIVETDEVVSKNIEIEVKNDEAPLIPRNPETEVVMPQKTILQETPQINTPLDGNPMKEAETNTVVTETTHPQLNLTEDKSEMIRLSEKAASVIVGNPNHISVLLDTPDTIIVVPRLPGASHFTVIGENGKVVMQRHVVVGAPKDDYVRIRRSCNASDANCQQTSVYYCPNTCHQVLENAATGRRR